MQLVPLLSFLQNRTDGADKSARDIKNESKSISLCEGSVYRALETGIFAICFYERCAVH